MLGARRIFWTLIAVFVCRAEEAPKRRGRMTKIKGNPVSSVSRPSPTFSAASVCKIFPDFTPKQTKFCMEHPRVASAIAEGIENGLQECESQFKHNRWNCTSTYSEIVSFGQNRAVPGTREAAFVTAIVAAGVAHSVTSACAKNNITGCICGESKDRRTAQRNWETEGCSNNIEHGIDISKKFLDGSGGPIGKNYELQIRHNRAAGRQAVDKSLVDFHCNCHGASGACTSKTCWKILSSSFERVGRFLKARHKDAMLVSIQYADSRDGRVPNVLTMAGTKFAKPPKEKLVYLEESGTYCDAIPSKGIAGTRGRVCDNTSSHSGGCHKLCCGRGYNKIAFETKTDCRCRFHWCCWVNCEKCRIKETRTVCK